MSGSTALDVTAKCNDCQIERSRDFFFKVFLNNERVDCARRDSNITRLSNRAQSRFSFTMDFLKLQSVSSALDVTAKYDDCQIERSRD